jgi:hypothetical protein
VNFKVAVVKVSEDIFGAKGVTQIRVAFVPQLMPRPDGDQPLNPIRPIRPPIRGFGVVNLEADMEGTFFLKKHHEEDFYILTPNCPPMLKKEANYDKELANVKKVGPILKNPLEAMKAKDINDRVMAAAIFTQKNNTYPQIDATKFVAKQQPISAEETKLVVDILLEADWSKVDQNNQFANPQTIFYSLNLQPQDGFKYPAFDGKGDFNKILKDSFTAWAKADSGKFRLKKWVAEKK